MPWKRQRSSVRGLSISGRDGLQRLLADVKVGNTDFEAVLVYDVSRWGRFQDADESAHYEYTCKQAGILVIYCAEQFENDGSPVSTIVKGVKRAMAGEYSRELSAKVFAGQCRLIELGFRQGGPAGFGLRRGYSTSPAKPRPPSRPASRRACKPIAWCSALARPRRSRWSIKCIAGSSRTASAMALPSTAT